MAGKAQLILPTEEFVPYSILYENSDVIARAVLNVIEHGDYSVAAAKLTSFFCFITSPQLY